MNNIDEKIMEASKGCIRNIHPKIDEIYTDKYIEITLNKLIEGHIKRYVIEKVSYFIANKNKEFLVETIDELLSKKSFINKIKKKIISSVLKSSDWD